MKNGAFGSFPQKMIAAAIVCAICFTVFAAITYNAYSDILLDNDVVAFDSEWTHNGETVMAFPYRTEESEATITRRLPSVMPSSPLLCFEASFQTVDVRVDGKSVYTFGSDAVDSYGVVLGSIWHTALLSEDCAGKEVSITVVSNGAAYFQNILLGSKSAVICHLLYSTMPIVMFCVFVALVAIFLIIAALVLHLRRYSYNTKAFLYVGLFLFSCALWVFTDSRAPQFIITNRALSYFVSVFSFLSIAPFFLLYMREVCAHYRRQLSVMCAVWALNIMVNAALFFLRCNPFTYSLSISHALLLVTILLVTLFSIREGYLYKNLSVREIRWGMYGMFAFVPVTIALYHFNGGKIRTTVIFYVGLALFLLLLCVNLLKRAFWNADAIATSRLYEKLAHIDSVTGVLNRTSFNRDMERLAQECAYLKSIGCVAISINNCETMCDNLGHIMSDEDIGKCAAIAADSFEGVGAVYRISGEVLAAVVKNKKESDISKALSKMDRRIGKENDKREKLFDIAYGEAYFESDMMTGANIYDTFAAADKKMYERRRRQNEDKSWRFHR